MSLRWPKVEKISSPVSINSPPPSVLQLFFSSSVNQPSYASWHFLLPLYLFDSYKGISSLEPISKKNSHQIQLVASYKI